MQLTMLSASEFFYQIYLVIRPLCFSQHSIVVRIFHSAKCCWRTNFPHCVVASIQGRISTHKYWFCQYIRYTLAVILAVNYTVVCGIPIDFHTIYFDRNHTPLNLC